MKKHKIFKHHRQLNEGEIIQKGDVWFLPRLDGSKTVRQIKESNSAGSSIDKVFSPDMGFIEGTVFLRRKEKTKKLDK